jgi:hypothetical protein
MQVVVQLELMLILQQWYAKIVSYPVLLVFNLKIIVQAVEVDISTTGMYQSTIYCYNCTGQCTTCTSPTFCTSCLTNFVIPSTGICVNDTNCPVGTYANTTNMRC